MTDEPILSHEEPYPLKEECDKVRAELLEIEQSTRRLVADKVVTGEAAAQAMLAVRHLEDARMRVGKVIQHGLSGGVSIFDKKAE